ncbi:WYL domain-containing protein [Clostridium butyricum]|uniref:WYL domain-containing protein n=1 Tax=Clostridium butyricum TaxID=1492 RepID=UPI002FD9F8A8
MPIHNLLRLFIQSNRQIRIYLDAYIKEKVKDIELKSSEITIDLTTWIGNRSIQYNIEKLKRALNCNKYLQFKYYEPNGNNNNRIMEPYKLILKENNWYIQGYSILMEFRDQCECLAHNIRIAH